MSEAQASVVVVDDDREMADVLCDVLRQAGYRSIGTNTGADALALVKLENPDVLVSDLRMSGMSGHHLQLELKRIAPNLPVIMITAFGSIQTAVESMKLRCLRLSHQTLQQRRAAAGCFASARESPAPPGGETAAWRARTQLRSSQHHRRESTHGGSAENAASRSPTAPPVC